MDFLKSQVTRAVAAFGKDVSLPFTIGAQVDNFNSSSIWTLHDGKKKVTIIQYIYKKTLLLKYKI